MSTVVAQEDPSLVHLGYFRIFVQEDGANPGADYNYHGYLELGGPNQPQGDLTPIYAPSPDQRDAWVIVGFTRAVQGLPTTDFTAHMMKELLDVWWKLKETRCSVNMQVLIGDCQAPDDQYDWTSKILLNSATLTDLTLPQMNPQSGENNAVGDLTGSMSMLGLERFLTISFEPQADTTITAEVLDGFYKGAPQCGNCGPADNGCNGFYSLVRSTPGSPGLSSSIVYSADDQSTWTKVDIATLGGKNADKIARMGKSLVAISEADGAHHVISFTDLQLGLTSRWRRVTGYAASGSPRVIYPISANRAIVGGAGGYIYELTNPGSSPITKSDGSIIAQNFNCIDGKGNVIVLGSNVGGVVISTNKGKSYFIRPIKLSNGTTLTGNVSAIGVQNPNTWFLAIGGVLYYTTNQGVTYTAHPGWPSGVSVINCIHFVDQWVGYITAQQGASALVFRTDSMGNNWNNAEPWFRGVPTAERFNFAYACGYNEVAIGGRVSSIGDGILAIAE